MKSVVPSRFARPLSKWPTIPVAEEEPALVLPGSARMGGSASRCSVSSMRRLFVMLLLLVPIISAEAHLGNENNTEVRVYSDTMRVVLRTSIPFAWNLLGDGAPALADEAGQAIAQPLLIAAAPGLITVTAGGKPMIPHQVDCLFEVEKDVAFVLNFERPAAWPAVVEARFFDRFSSLDTGTIQVFDYTASRFSRDLEPVAKAVIDQGSPSLSFTLAAAISPTPVPEAVPPTPAAVAAPTAGTSRTILAVIVSLLAAAWVGFLTCRRWRGASKAP
ncbi:MAG: hypothetical protein V4819_13345 [Verrucomicrobiota bacterium]